MGSGESQNSRIKANLLASIVFCKCNRFDDSKNCYGANIIGKRNDKRLNKHLRIQWQGWRANCDIQLIVDHHACVEYLAKYTSKGEICSLLLEMFLFL